MSGTQKKQKCRCGNGSVAAIFVVRQQKSSIIKDYLANGGKQDGFAVLTHGFGLLEVMSPPMAANDVSPLTLRSDVARYTRSDAMFAHVPKAHITCAANITWRSQTSLAPQGQTSFKKRLLSTDKRRFLLCLYPAFDTMDTKGSMGAFLCIALFYYSSGVSSA